MLEILKKKTGKDYVIYVLDEVGQYVASRQNLILNLDGLAKNPQGSRHEQSLDYCYGPADAH